MVADPRDLRRRLSAVAASQSGYFTAAQALDVGYSYPQQKFHTDHGNWLRVDRGIFRMPDWPVGPHDDLVRWDLWSKGRAVVSHETALGVHDLGEFDPARVHLTVPPSFRARDPHVVLHHDTLEPDDVRRQGGFSVTTPLRSLIDVAAIGVDEDQLGRAIQEASDSGQITLRRLRERAEAVDARAALRIERAIGSPHS